MTSAKQRGVRTGVLLTSQTQDEIREVAERTGRPVSWVVRRAWELARERIRTTPAPPAPSTD